MDIQRSIRWSDRHIRHPMASDMVRSAHTYLTVPKKIAKRVNSSPTSFACTQAILLHQFIPLDWTQTWHLAGSLDLDFLRVNVSLWKNSHYEIGTISLVLQSVLSKLLHLACVVIPCICLQVLDWLWCFRGEYAYPWILFKRSTKPHSSHCWYWVH